MKPLDLSEREAEYYDVAERCYICERECKEPTEIKDDNGKMKGINDNYIKVRDHCHLSGEFRGAAHKICNLNLKLLQSNPVYCHNMSNYDPHLYIKELAKQYKNVDLIVYTGEKYINYTVNSGYGYEFDKMNKPRKFVKLSFVDTFRFTALSIEKLTKGFKQDDCKNINNFISDGTILNKILR